MPHYNGVGGARMIGTQHYSMTSPQRFPQSFQIAAFVTHDAVILAKFAPKQT
jgi:hypothetical protein